MVWRTTAFSEPRQRVRSRRHAATCTSQRFPRESDADGRCGSPEDHNQLGGTTRPAAATCKRRKGRPRPLLPRSREPTCGGAVLRRALKMPALMVFAPHCSVCKSRRAAHVRFACTSINNCLGRLSIPLAAFSRFYRHMRKLMKRNAPSRETWCASVEGEKGCRCPLIALAAACAAALLPKGAAQGTASGCGGVLVRGQLHAACPSGERSRSQAYAWHPCSTMQIALPWRPCTSPLNTGSRWVPSLWL